MKQQAKPILTILLILCVLTQTVSSSQISAKTSSGCTFIILSKYHTSMKIGDELYIAAITSTGKLPKWKSSDSKTASVNTYGKITAKKPGTVSITAKIKGAEACCKVTVSKTVLTLNASSFSLEHNQTAKLTAKTSNGSSVTYKSNKKSVAIVNEDGLITALKPGEAVITVKANTTEKTCKVKVKSPTITLSKRSATLYRSQQLTLTASVSSKITPVWKSNKKSVATVDETGTITAIKHGTAIISATVDGISRTCEINVEKPVITLSRTELDLKTGNTATLTAKVSSGNAPVWSSSNSNVASVTDTGTITALKKGKAYIYAKEDGTKERCIVTVS